jgi:hypothetical protein
LRIKLYAFFLPKESKFSNLEKEMISPPFSFLEKEKKRIRIKIKIKPVSGYM